MHAWVVGHLENRLLCSGASSESCPSSRGRPASTVGSDRPARPCRMPSPTWRAKRRGPPSSSTSPWTRPTTRRRSAAGGVRAPAGGREAVGQLGVLGAQARHEHLPHPRTQVEHGRCDRGGCEHHARQDAGLPQCGDGLQARLGVRGAGFGEPPHIVVDGREGQRDARAHPATGCLGEDVEVAADERALGQDRERVAGLRAGGDDAPGQAVAAFGTQVGVGVGTEGNVLAARRSGAARRAGARRP